MDNNEGTDKPDNNAGTDPRAAWDTDLRTGTATAAPKKECASGGAIEMGNPYPATCLAVDKTMTQDQLPGQASAAQEPTNWTVAIDLAWDFKAQNQPDWAQYQAEKLAQLKEESRGKPVAMVVQVYAQGKTADGKDENQLQRLIIRNGEVISLGQQASQGEAADLRDLLKLASTQAPSKNIGLIVNEDGIAGAGFMGNGGHMDLSEFNQAISDGLSGSNHDKLDVLDLDSCLMGHTAVLDKLKAVSDHVVASSDTETGRTEKTKPLSAGQDIVGVMKDLFASPNMTGGQLADDFIKRADDQAKSEHQSLAGEEFYDWAPNNATLAHFDTTRIGDFESSLDKFGQALAKAARDPNNFEQIQSLAEASRPLPLDGGSGQHDLQSFVVQVQKAIREGKLSDQDGSIEKAAGELLDEQHKFIVASHIDQSSPYKGQGGLGTFLPDAQFAQALKRQDPLSQLQDGAFSNLSESVAPDEQKRYLEAIDTGIAGLTTRVPEALRGQMEALLQARKALGESKDGDQFAQRFNAFNKEVWALSGNEIGRSMRSQDQTALDQWFAASKLTSAPGWNAFIDLLKPAETR
jgi:hypothetical protein